MGREHAYAIRDVSPGEYPTDSLRKLEVGSSTPPSQESSTQGTSEREWRWPTRLPFPNPILLECSLQIAHQEKRMMINSLSNFKKPPIPTLPGTAQMKAGSSFSEGRGAGLGWQGLFGGLRRKEQQRRCCDFFQQFLGLSRRSQPLPPRLHLPCCGGGQCLHCCARLLGFFLPRSYPGKILSLSLRTVGHGWTTLYAWPWEAHITVGVWSVEGGMADLDRSQGTGSGGGGWGR